MDPTTDTVYVANGGSQHRVGDRRGHQHRHRHHRRRQLPVGVAVDPATNTVYVANQDSGNVSVIDGATNTVTATISVGSNPEGWRWTPPRTPSTWLTPAVAPCR